MSDYFDPKNKELLKDFYAEAELQVDMLEQNILALENDPDNREAIDEIFRAAHTLKGGSATVQMNELAEFTHIIEDILDEIRNGKLKIIEEVISCLLKSIDIIKAMLNSRIQGNIYSEDISETVELLKNYLSIKEPETIKTIKTINKPKDKKTQIEKEPQIDVEINKQLSEYEILELREIAGKQGNLMQVSVEFDEDNPMNTVGGIQVYAVIKDVGKILKTIPDFDSLYEDTYYPTVDYYIISSENIEKIQSICTINDVTKGIKVTIIKETKQSEEGDVTTVEKDAIDEENVDKDAPVVCVKEKPLSQPERKKEEKKQEAISPHVKHDKKQADSRGSILRVDSRRIDDLLNLVTETVINKAAFNQISSLFTNILVEYEDAEISYKEKIREIIKKLSTCLGDLEDDKILKTVKNDIIENDFLEFSNIYNVFSSKLKSTIGLFKETIHNLSRISSELQTGVMHIRMVQISQIFSRFPRLIRDLSKQLDKNIKLHITGEETELDKSVIEDLLDPLIHCVRNSIDHGIESTKDRIAAGKTEHGNIYLKAENEGNLIIIEIYDDGKGIDIDMIKQKAINKGLIYHNKNLSDIEAYNLIFEPGFSTSSNVTNISGRGVGLDVVKKQIEKLNGSVSVWSEKGCGTKFTIKLPLTLAIIQGLLVKLGNQIYAIPIASINESIRLKSSEIKMIDNYEVFNLREDVLSLIRLDHLFNIKTDNKKPHCFIVVVGSGEKMVGLVVDSLIGEEDVVIKPLKDRFANTPGIAGATILGDGTVALIIDVNQLLDYGLKIEIQDRQKREAVLQN